MTRLAWKLCMCCLGLMVCTPALAQETLWEQFAPQEEESSADGENVLEELLADPVDLNQVPAALLVRLPFLGRTQVEAFLEQRKAAVYFDDLEQALQALAVTGDTLRFCRTVFTVSLPAYGKTPTPWRLTARGRVIVPPQSAPEWPGPPYRSYTKLQLRAGEIRAGVLTERDPGETRHDDHRVFHAEWRRERTNTGWQIVAGNYLMEWAHGLTQWGAYGTNIASDVHAASRRRGAGLRPYLATNENAALQGAAVAVRHGRMTAMLFLSRTRLDATVDDNERTVNYRTGGYHRTPSEIRQRKNLAENLTGGALVLKIAGHGEAGVLAYRTRFDRAWHPGHVASDYHDFTGNSNHVISIMGRAGWRELGFSWEAARSASTGKGLAVVITGPDRLLSWTASFHHYDRNFHSPHGLGMTGGEGQPQGEAGFSAGLSFKPGHGFTAEFFLQRTKNLWRTRMLPWPPAAASEGVTATWKMSPRWTIQARYRKTTSEQLLAASGGVVQPQLAASRERLRLEFEHRATPSLRLRPRLELARECTPALETSPLVPGDDPAVISGWRLKQVGRLGTALSLEVSWSPWPALALSYRETVFDTPVPIYQYERDLPGVFTVQALRERGLRRYIYWHLKATSHFGMALKISGTDQGLPLARNREDHAWSFQLEWNR